ncbi:MAG: hypothetical protein IKV41_01435 [Oscillospiraceae bacterium]|nr:hypothetical protein [Oscillospiraceae bacterium]
MDFDSPVTAHKPINTNIDKINFLLADMTEEQQKDILKIIRIFAKFPENE